MVCVLLETISVEHLEIISTRDFWHSGLEHLEYVPADAPRKIGIEQTVVRQ
jgi:hypothetical protein